MKAVSKTSVIKQKTNNWERQMKARFISIAQSDMPYAEVIEHCIREDEQNRRMAKINYRIQCFRNDGIFQLNQAITEVFGSVTSVNNDSPSGDSSIQTVDITLADGTRTKAPYGDISLEALGEGSQISINYNTSSHELVVTGKCQVRFQSLMDDIIEVTKRNLATNSIYKGQALEITDINDPKIIDLSSIDNQLMVLSDKTKYDLRPIHARILNPEKCIEKGIPLKYGALMEGPYGTGKTLLAFKLAKQAIENGWMFIYLKEPRLLAEALRMSKVIDKSGHGALVFVEDIDQVVRGNRDAAMQDILNTLDGGDTKDMNVITLFTTNHIELIEPTFLRGKRIGTIISMGYLDAKTAEKFIRQSFEIGGYVIKEDISEVCKMIEESDIAPAFMAEIIESVKSVLVLDDDNEVTQDSIKFAVQAYKRQVSLAHKKDMTVTPEKKFVDAFNELFVKQNSDAIEVITKMAEDSWDINRNDYKD